MQIALVRLHSQRTFRWRAFPELLAKFAGARGSGKKTFIVALAPKLLLALWRYATLGEIPEGFVLKSA
jgi:hypothetical protein